MNLHPENRKTMLPYLLDALAKQTGLQYKVESRPEEVWVATEETE